MNEINGHVTNHGAITVEPIAIQHHQYIPFTETRSGTGVAANGAVLTGVDALLVLLGAKEVAIAVFDLIYQSIG
ncbi:hypothetical protein [Fibrella arboris]|uniref:hypothetical protein n=1 Tax=Fibrella arboris TaxID=3242486 RepID=UPI003520ADAF